jgi:histidinol-phosphate aminotransferase
MNKEKRSEIMESDECVDPLAAIKPAVKALKAYSLTPDRGVVKINQNENPWDAPEQVKHETLRRFDQRAWSRYPDFVPAALHQKLANFSGWTEEGIVAGNGSNELIQALLMVTVGEKSRVLISEPTFALYRQIATILNGEVVSVPLKPDFSFDVSAILRAVEEYKPSVTIICSPNNPTGSVLSDADLESLLNASRGIVAVDEAYFEFASHSVVPLLERHRNLAVFRTFSKAMAMAALRVGYLLADPHLAREIRKSVLPYNLNAFSQIAGEAAIEMYEDTLAPLVRSIVDERGRLYASLNGIRGLSPVASQSNFMIVKSRIEPRRVFGALLQKGILIRDVSGSPMLSDYFRVSVGTPEENDALIAALTAIFSQEAF